MDETRELIRAAAQGDTTAADKLVRENSGLIWSVVRRFLNRGAEAEDLYQIGAIGLIKSIYKFDLSYDVRFSTYAVPMIMGEIKRYLRDDGILKVSRSIKENSTKIAALRERYMALGEEEPTVGEIAGELGLTGEEVTLAIGASREVESLHKTLYTGKDGNDVTLMEKLRDDRGGEDRLVNSIVLNSLIQELPDRERKIIELRYFRDKTQSRVAEELGISQVQVSRIEKRILNLMRERMEE